MTDAPRIMVTLPTPHDATAHMARVLHEEGLLGDYVVPLDLSKRRLPAAVEARVDLDQWRHPIPAVSGAPVHELVAAAGFRMLSGRSWARGTRWFAEARANSLDKASARRLRLGRNNAVLVLQGRTPRVANAARKLGILMLHQANADSWGIEERLTALADQAPDDETRRDILGEVWKGDAARATQSMRSAACVLVESSRMQKRVRSLVGDSVPSVALGQGVDAGFFVPAPRDYSSGALAVTHISRVGYAKGVHITNEGIAQAGAAVAHCTVAGWDMDLTPLLVRRSTRVKFDGGLPKARVRGLLQQSDVFVLPTLADSMPRAVLEAMACGLPVITTGDSGYDDVIEHGVNGFVVPPGDAGAVAALLTQLSRDGELRRRVGAAARATAEANTWEAFGERFRSKLYAEILPSLGASAR